MPPRVTPRLIMQKARSHPVSLGHCPKETKLLLIVGTWFQVLFHSRPRVLFTFPSRYSCTIGQRVVFSLRRWSAQIPTGFHVSRGTWEPAPGGSLRFRLRDCHPLWSAYSRTVRLSGDFVTSREVRSLLRTGPTTPLRQRLRAFTPKRFRLFPFRSPLLRESMSLSFPPGTEMFHFPGYRLPAKAGMTRLIGRPGFPIRASRAQSLFAAPPGLSQLTTPFIASLCQGIHHVPLVAWTLNSTQHSQFSIEQMCYKYNQKIKNVK